jgi:anti-anti-sigma factor
MHISVEPREDHAVLHLRGEFDTYYVPVLQQEIDALIKAGVVHAILDLRFVKFINSTALGAIIKASKLLHAKGGRLVIAHPSVFCRDIIEKVGLDRVVNVFDTTEDAAASLADGRQSKPHGHEGIEENPSTVLFAPVDHSRTEHFFTEAKRSTKEPAGKEKLAAGWSGAGRMAALDAKGLRFTWSGGNTGLSPFAMGQLLALGTEWRVKFRLPLLQRGYCEAVCTISEVEERPDGVKVAATFKSIDDRTRDAIRQYATDMAFLKDELRKATDA